MAKSKTPSSLTDHPKQGQLPIRTNAIYVGRESLNIYMTYDQAVQVATNFLKKAELLKGNDGMAIQLWTKKNSNKLYFGIDKVRQKGSQQAWE